MQELIDAIAHTWELFVSLIGAFFAAFLGVLMRYGHGVSQGEKWDWWKVVRDIPTVSVMGLSAGALGGYLHDHYGLPEVVQLALAANFGYLGPKLVDRIASLLEKKAGE